MRKHFAKLKVWYSSLSNIRKVTLVFTTLLFIFVVYKIAKPSVEIEQVKVAVRSVKLMSVGESASSNTNIPLVGIVTSISEANIRSESSGRLTRVYKKLGDKVYAGQVIAEFENSGERAVVLQAQGSYESAKAGRDITIINSATTNTNINDIKASALNTISSAYTVADDIVHAKTDGFYIDAKNVDQVLQVRPIINDDNLASGIVAKRKMVESLLKDRESKNRKLNIGSDLVLEIYSVQAEMQTIKSYIDDLSVAYNKAIPTNDFNQAAIDNAKSVVGGARSAILGVLASLSTVRTGLTSALAAQDIAGGNTNTKSPAISISDASVKIALGGYQAALSRLEKTIVRSPITGTLNSLSIETGDYVGQSTPVAVVSNNGALEIVTYISEDDAHRVTVGSAVNIYNSNDGIIKGIVIRQASAIDPVTKKIELRVGIVGEKSTLINGESVRLEVVSIDAIAKKPASKTYTFTKIKIPLSAIKITPRGSYVFTVSSTSSLISIPVVAGALLGENIQIESGLTREMSIVRDARGLKEGQIVELAK